MYFSFFRISRTRESFHLPPETVGTPLASSARAMPTVETAGNVLGENASYDRGFYWVYHNDAANDVVTEHPAQPDHVALLHSLPPVPFAVFGNRKAFFLSV